MSKLQDLMKANPKDFMKILKGENEDQLAELEDANAPEEEAADKKGKNKKGKATGTRIATIGLGKYEPTLPSVNLIPLEVEEGYASSKLARKFVFIGIGIVGVLALVWGAGFALDMVHKASIAELDGKASGIQAQISEKQPFQGYQSEVADERSTLATQLQADVNVGKIMNSLNNLSEQSSVTLTSVSIAFNSGGGVSGTAETSTSSCANPDPFGEVASIGCITLSGDGASRDGVNAFFNTIDGTEGFANSFISSVGAAGGGEAGAPAAAGATFQGTVSITDFFTSGRFTDLALPLESILTGGEPAAGDASTTVDDNEAQLLLVTLQSNYPNVFPATVDPAAVKTMASQLCAGVIDGTLADPDAYGTVIASALGTSVESTVASTITSETVEAVCPAGTAQVTTGVES